ncbi:MAG: DNA polymerase III subunit delta [Bacteroidia bacterium]
MGFTYEQILNDLKNKKYHPIYFLCGEEPYYIDKISDYIENHVLDEAEKSFNQTILYGRDTDAITIINEAKRYPMMADRQVVIVKEAQDIKKIEELNAYFENPTPTTLLVICYKKKSVDKRTAFGKNVSKNSVYFESAKLYDNKIPEWIDAYVKEKKYKIDPKAAIMLTEFLGNDLAKISNEIDKLILNISSNEIITPAIIEIFIGISKDYNVFELTKALGLKDVLKANRIVNYFAANPKNNPFILIISNLYSYFNKLIITHSLKNQSDNVIASELGVNPFFVKEYKTACANYDYKKLVEIISLLHEYDLKSKGVNNNQEDSELLKELVFKILH